MSLGDITSAVDADYAKLIAFVKGHQRHEKTDNPHIAKLFHRVMDELSVRQVNGIELIVLQGTRIVVPLPARKSVIRELHNAYAWATGFGCSITPLNSGTKLLSSSK